MMSHLALRFLGSPEIEVNACPCPVKLKKALALLAFLSLHGSTIPRDLLAAILWPDVDDARTQLRYALWSLRSQLGGEWLLTEDDLIGLNPSAHILVDANQFQSLIGRAAPSLRAPIIADPAVLALLEQAVAFYRDDFLSGFSLRGCPDFDEWQSLRTEAYRQDLSLALQSLVTGLAEIEAYERALSYARRWLALDPLHEDAHRSLMQLYDRTGHRADAIHQYELCKRYLHEELHIGPDERTVALYQEILKRRPNLQPRSIELQEEVRPVTVLCIGLVESPLPAQREVESVADDTYDLWESVTQCLSMYAARIDQILGNSLLAIFGADQIHEDDAERAARAAIAVRAEAQRSHMQISLGANSGAAYVARQPGQVHTSLVMGSVVNLATRLQSQAHVGEILLSPATHRQIAQSFACTPVPIAPVGQQQPLTAFRLERMQPHPRKTRGLGEMASPLVGRGPEMAELRRLLDLTQSGSGQIALISGEGGIGKSRLVEELRAEDQRRFPKTRWLVGRCQEMGISTHFWPVRELLHSLFGSTPAADRAEAILSLTQRFVASGIMTLAQRAQLLPVLAHLTGVTLGAPWDHRFDDEEPEVVRAELIQGMQRFLQALTQQGPLALIFEDLHWADSLSLDLFIRLMDGLAELPLLLVGVYRPETRHRVWQLPAAAAQHGPGRFEQLALHPLSPAQGRQLLHNLLSTDQLPAAVDTYVLAQAQGNPLYLEETVRNLLEGGALVRDQRGWQLAPHAELSGVSENMQIIMLARADRLEPGLRDLLKQMAVLGQRFPISLLAAFQRGEPVREAALATLVEQRFLYQESSHPQPIYAFTHALIQQTLYSSLVEKDRRRLHGLVAQTLEAADRSSTAEDVATLAHHWEQSDQPGRAIPYLLEAGERARLSFATQEAEAYYRRAIAVQGQTGDEMGAARTWMALGLTYLNAHEYAQSQAAYNAGYDLWTVAGRRAPAVIRPARRPLRELCGFRNTSLDPARQDSPVLGSALFSGLFEETPDLLAAPDLARHWSVSADGCTYTFRLHEDRRWSDGAPVTAHDLIFAWRRLLDPQSGFSTAPLLYDVAGAEAYHRGQLADPEQLGLALLDDLTFSVTLREPTSYFLQILTHPATYPVPRHLLLSNSESAWDPANIVTNGAFRVVSWKKMAYLWERDQYGLVAERNPGYPGRFPGNLQRIESGPTDWSVAAHLHDDGELDVLALMLMPDDDSRRLLRTQGWQFLPNRHWDVVYLGFDTTQPPFDDVRVRQAFAMSIDRPQMARLFVPGSPPTTGGFVPRGMGGHSPEIGLPYDPGSARQLLAQAGYPGGASFPEVEYVTPPQAGRLKDTVLDFVQSNLGIHLTWQPIGAEGMPSPRRLFMWTCSAPYADPSCYLRLGFPWRDTGWRDPVYERLLDEARRTLDLPRRLDLYRAADRILMEQAVIVPLYMGTSPVLVKPWVTHYPISGIRWAYYKDVVLHVAHQGDAS